MQFTCLPITYLNQIARLKTQDFIFFAIAAFWLSEVVLYTTFRCIFNYCIAIYCFLSTLVASLCDYVGTISLS